MDLKLRPERSSEKRTGDYKQPRKEDELAGKMTRQRETSKLQVKLGLKVTPLQAYTMLKVNKKSDKCNKLCFNYTTEIGCRIDDINTISYFLKESSKKISKICHQIQKLLVDTANWQQRYQIEVLYM
ncbi:hypothetical protein VNO78_17103 [Psophocarpus tetragonolobus]|uniref:Uncharacterized protein n=1 Tax=Psophocarpus tetragonolobus TaxID=3891 RepID=A0AAN9XL19_PSOTE